MAPIMWSVLVACATADGAPAGPLVLAGGTVLGHGVADVELRDGRIAAIGDVDPEVTRLDVSGQVVAPAVADSHVHLAYWEVADELAASGVALAVDLAAPLASLERPPDAPEVRWAGPMITAVGGYPTRSWGAGGYGLEVDTADAAAAAVDTVADAGARLIKVPIGAGPELTDAQLDAVVARAHERDLKVVAHALTDADAARAAAHGVDALAHTPTAALSDATVEAWSGRVVISTLTAFGGTDTTIDNLRRLAAGGATVLYGTDLGNTRTAAIDGAELDALGRAGLDGAAILAALTTAPAAFWGWEGGRVEVGAPADLVVLPRDPVADPTAWTEPTHVVRAGGVVAP